MSESNKNILAWALRLIAAVIMLQTLYFKFTAAEESVYIFSTLGMEPWGRIGTGVMELIASILILMPRTTAIGAALGVGIMGGAILSHIFVLGISVMGDNGQLFVYALLVFFSALGLLYLQRRDIPYLKWLNQPRKIR
ncbi:MAG TPA: DoxX family protein [Chitinophagaceae bacterium]|nr:DoxX family protein [Chitinophagaceae bacterium]